VFSLSLSLSLCLSVCLSLCLALCAWDCVQRGTDSSVDVVNRRTARLAYTHGVCSRLIRPHPAVTSFWHNLSRQSTATELVASYSVARRLRQAKPVDVQRQSCVSALSTCLLVLGFCQTRSVLGKWKNRRKLWETLEPHIDPDHNPKLITLTVWVQHLAKYATCRPKAHVKLFWINLEWYFCIIALVGKTSIQFYPVLPWVIG